MTVGTKSLLFGVHQFVWHPWCVARAWRRLYGRWPAPAVWLAIVLHDAGYWGCVSMDGKDGKRHPVAGARLVRKVVLALTGDSKYARRMHEFTAGHSRSFSKILGVPPSRLYVADKVAVLMEPGWFYLLRAWLSGEGEEYARNSPLAGKGLRRWLAWYRFRVRRKFLAKGRDV